MKESNIRNKSFVFAVRIVKLYKYLNTEKKEFVLSKQLLRSGTFVGAMVREAEHAESKADFIHKMAIAQKEINETIYWLELLATTDYLEKQEFESINNDAVELIKILTTIIKNTKSGISGKLCGGHRRNLDVYTTQKREILFFTIQQRLQQRCR